VRIGLLAIGGWLVAAVLTVGLSWSAISVVRSSVVPATTVALPAPDESTGTTAAPTTTRPTTAPTAGAVVSKSGQGGVVNVRCTNGRPVFVNVVPRQGFRAESDESDGQVEFRSSDHRTEITVSCAGLTPQFKLEERTSGGGGGGDDSGGDDNGGGSGRGGSGRGGGD
jgi:hypothetical protein